VDFTAMMEAISVPIANTWPTLVSSPLTNTPTTNAPTAPIPTHTADSFLVTHWTDWRAE